MSCRRMLGIAFLLCFCLVLAPGRVRADDGIVKVVYPPPSKTDGRFSFSRIPWNPGDKISGSLEVTISKPVRNLSVHAASGALTLDPNSRRVIPRHRIQFYRSDIAQGAATATADANKDQTLTTNNHYMFDFTVDGIPGEDTYVAQLEATGEYLDEQSGKWQAFQHSLPSLKLKAYGEAAVKIPGRSLTEQWTNMHAPFAILAPLEVFLDFGKHEFFYHYNPEAVVNITIPGPSSDEIKSGFSQSLTVTLDPVLDEHDNATPWIHFRKVAADQEPQSGFDVPMTQTFDKLPPNETVQFAIYRDHTIGPDGRVTSERIPPGIYRSNLRIHAEWGSDFVLPVEIRVRDHPFWSIFTLVLGVVVSLMSNYWQSRQPLYQAQVKARKLQRLYVDQGVQLSIVERVIQRLNGCLLAADAPGVGQATSLLEDLIRRMPDAMVIESMMRELEATPGVSRAQLWAKFLEATKLDEALQGLREYCGAHPAPPVQEFGPRFETLQWFGATEALSPIVTSDFKTAVRSWLRDLFGGRLLDWQRTTVRVVSPGLWDHLTVVVLFILINGGLIALQMSESYAPNMTFGSATDYLNLLFWGFAGDATRTKVTALAGNFRTPGDGKGAATPGAQAAPPAAPTPAPAPSPTPPAVQQRAEPPAP